MANTNRQFYLFITIIFVFQFCCISAVYGASSIELVGAKAPRMGGAFCADSSDASSLIYNPAGIANTSTASVSGSVTGYSLHTMRALNSYGGKDLKQSYLSANSFIGFVNPFNQNWIPNLAIVFYIPENASLDQEYQLGQSTEFHFKSLYAVQKSQQQIYSGIIGTGWKLSDTVSLGFAAQVYYLTDTEQKYLSATIVEQDNEIATNNSTEYLVNIFSALNTHSSGLAGGARLGIIWRANSDLNLGLSVSNSRFIQNSKINSLQQLLIATRPDGNIIPANSLPDITGKLTQNDIKISTTTSDRLSFDSFPFLLRTGLSWTPTSTLKFNSDIFISSRQLWKEKKSNNKYRNIGNVAGGAEYNFLNGYFASGAIFSDFNDNLSPDQSKTNFGGVSLAFGMFSSDSETALTLTQMYGEGKSSPIGYKKQKPTVKTIELATFAQFSLTKRL